MDDEINVYGDIDELTLEELYILQKRLCEDIEFIKLTETRSGLDSEVDRLKYVNELIKERENDIRRQNGK